MNTPETMQPDAAMQESAAIERDGLPGVARSGASAPIFSGQVSGQVSGLAGTSRRRALVTAASGVLLALAGAPLVRHAHAATDASSGAGHTAAGGDARFVFVILRGGMDGLSAVPAVGDPDFARARGVLAEHPPAAGGGGSAASPLPLDGLFALHPLLSNLHGMYGAGELLVAHAICSLYRERSHFDAQNVLEGGAMRAFATSDGWVNRALAAASARADVASAPQAIAIGAGIPLALRGALPVSSWAPSVLPDPDADLVARASALYANDRALARALADARAVHEADERARAGGQFPELMAAAARFLASPTGPRIAVLELPGWDTHSTQAHPAGGLARNLRQLDAGMAAMKAGLGAAWARTVVVAASEFGRTVAVNGTGGTDHGTGGAVLVAGGAVQGGRVLADWPGLGEGARFEGRDLTPTRDLRVLLKGLLQDHLQLSRADLDERVFPGSSPQVPLQDLIRQRASR